MRNKRFIVINLIIVSLSAGLLLFRMMRPSAENPIRPSDDSRAHVPYGTKRYVGTEPPTSGPHASPMPWQSYDADIDDANALHNLEHGGIYISYRFDLPAVQVDRIKSLFSQPSSRPGFNPVKILIAPRTPNQSPIVLSAWEKNLKLESFDEDKMVEFYESNVNQAPESGEK